MKPSKTNHDQDLMFQSRLSQQLDPSHELYILAYLIDWESFEQEFSGLFSESKGAPARPVRLVTGIFMLQHMSNLSDEAVVKYWEENPYWQYFCGYDYLQWRCPIHPSSLSKWRKLLGSRGMRKVLEETVRLAVKVGAAKPSSFKKVIVDTTVMPKNVAYPTDSRLYYRGIKLLVKMAKNHNIELRQTYTFLSKQALRKVNRYAHARQMKRAKRECKRLKTYLGRVCREIDRKTAGNELLRALFKPALEVIEKVLTQEKSSKNKVYSIHEPFVECISKGKPHKKYEFGCKVSLVITHKEGLALSAEALYGNPYDGHTLKNALEEAESLFKGRIEAVFVDRGYKGNRIEEKNIFISGQKRGVTPWIQKQIKRRQAIEPHIGHMKSDGKLSRNYLKGILGDQLNAILCGVGHNVRLVIRKLHCLEQFQFA
jgi:IS5 family transposase